MKSILSLAGVFIALSCAAQAPVSPKTKPKLSLRQLIHRNPNEPNSTYHKHFVVDMVDGRLHITRQVSSSVKTYPVAGGSLIALNVGEWGGGLYYKPDDTTCTGLIVNQKMVPILRKERYSMVSMLLSDPNFKLNDAPLASIHDNGNASAITPFKGSLLVGIGHFSFTDDEGSLLMVTRTEDGFTTEKLMDLGDAPVAITTNKDKIYIATNKGLVVVDNGQVTLKLPWVSDRFWVYNMAMKDERHIYMGLEKGYAKLDIITKKFTIYNYYQP